MNTTILILIATMLVTVLSFYTVFKTKFTFNVYANIIILVLVSLFIGYHISNIPKNGEWYHYGLLMVLLYGVYNVFNRIKSNLVAK